MRRGALLAALAALLASGAAPAADVPEDVDRLLWCGSAMYWLGMSASDAGEDSEADQYQGWSDTLTGRGAQKLTVMGYSGDRIDQVISGYDDRVVEDLLESKVPYDAADCPTLAQSPAE